MVKTIIVITYKDISLFFKQGAVKSKLSFLAKDKITLHLFQNSGLQKKLGLKTQQQFCCFAQEKNLHLYSKIFDSNMIDLNLAANPSEIRVIINYVLFKRLFFQFQLKKKEINLFNKLLLSKRQQESLNYIRFSFRYFLRTINFFNGCKLNLTQALKVFDRILQHFNKGKFFYEQGKKTNNFATWYNNLLLELQKHFYYDVLKKGDYVVLLFFTNIFFSGSSRLIMDFYKFQDSWDFSDVHFLYKKCNSCYKTLILSQILLFNTIKAYPTFFQNSDYDEYTDFGRCLIFKKGTKWFRNFFFLKVFYVYQFLYNLLETSHTELVFVTYWEVYNFHIQLLIKHFKITPELFFYWENYGVSTQKPEFKKMLHLFRFYYMKK